MLSFFKKKLFSTLTTILGFVKLSSKKKINFELLFMTILFTIVKLRDILFLSFSFLLLSHDISYSTIRTRMFVDRTGETFLKFYIIFSKDHDFSQITDLKLMYQETDVVTKDDNANHKLLILLANHSFHVFLRYIINTSWYGNKFIHLLYFP